MDSEFNPTEILLVFGSNIRKSREMQEYSLSNHAFSTLPNSIFNESQYAFNLFIVEYIRIHFACFPTINC